MKKNPYADGYQDALREVLVMWHLDGADAALAYINNNLVAPTRPVSQPCTMCGDPVRRNGRGELIHANYMSHAHDHTAAVVDRPTIPADVLRAKAVVESDLAKWRRGDFT